MISGQQSGTVPWVLSDFVRFLDLTKESKSSTPHLQRLFLSLSLCQYLSVSHARSLLFALSPSPSRVRVHTLSLSLSLYLVFSLSLSLSHTNTHNVEGGEEERHQHHMQIY